MLNPTRASFAFTHPACRSSARHGRLDNTKEGSADAQELAHSRHTSSSTWCVPSCPSPPHGRNQKYYIPPRRGFFFLFLAILPFGFFFLARRQHVHGSLPRTLASARSLCSQCVSSSPRTRRIDVSSHPHHAPRHLIPHFIIHHPCSSSSPSLLARETGGPVQVQTRGQIQQERSAEAEGGV